MKTVMEYEQIAVVNRQELEDLQKQCDGWMRNTMAAEAHYEKEHRLRMRERHDADCAENALKLKNLRLETELRTARQLGVVEKFRLQRTIPRYVITAIAAVLAIIVPSVLQKLSVIGPQLAYAMECVLFMVATWCAAIVWERARK